ncbi:MAG: dephospho-CoA kinase [Candidatus Abyssobacteria bacterium SURF_17]|uniref:Dephospho-CoA kinase n=1 Tax=Candidatus Abyssobacteria bacterium SURF_17 TaxID=2093361 RepID=A0A419F9N3_9BACT|nr:MAG: dephospho-CoA kinase [Candidatus Abyssubacteria bacterium SURF_17]
MIIGLTGGIASGKSAVAAMFEKRGAHVINFDVLARVVVEPDMPAWKDIVAHFGTDILNEDRTLNRAKLGDIVFSDVQQRKALESFIYPQLFVEYNRRIEEIRSKDPNAIVFADVPLLFEIRLQSMFDKIVVVYATSEQQMKRLIERDGLDHESALKRLNAQMPLEQKMQQADYVIHNTGSLQETEADVNETWNTLSRLKQ